MKTQEMVQKSDRILKVLRPAVDIYEDEEGLRLLADLPGVAQDALELQVEGGLLSLSAQRPYGEGVLEYRRRFQVPRDIDSAQIKAVLDSGVLELRLPRAEAYKPRRIPVQIRG